MPTFAYRALNQAGQKSQGTVVAATRRDALKRLIAGGQNVLDLSEETSGGGNGAVGFRLRRRYIRLSTFA